MKISNSVFFTLFIAGIVVIVTFFYLKNTEEKVAETNQIPTVTILNPIASADESPPAPRSSLTS